MTVRANAPARMGSGFQNTRGPLISTIQIDFNKMPNGERRELRLHAESK